MHAPIISPLCTWLRLLYLIHVTPLLTTTHQTAFLTLDEALKVTNRRVNALENVVKPKLENTISYIKGASWRGPMLRLRACG